MPLQRTTKKNGMPPGNEAPKSLPNHTVLKIMRIGQGVA